MRVLIADDRLYMRAALRGFLSLHTNLDVCAEAGDGVEAVAQARSHHPDLVLMDLAMPTINGAEAALVIKKMLPDVRIIIFTLYGDVAGQALAKAEGVDLIVPKAEGAAGLTNALQTLLSKAPEKSDEVLPSERTVEIGQTLFGD